MTTQKPITKEDVVNQVREMLRLKANMTGDVNLCLDYDASEEDLDIIYRPDSNSWTHNDSNDWDVTEVYRINNHDTVYDMCQVCKTDPDWVREETCLISDEEPTDKEILLECTELFDPDILDDIYDKILESREEWHQELQNREEI